VHDIFKGEGIAPIKGVRSDVGDTWFVTCASEADATSIILALRNKTFEGKPIKARLKSENILRAFFPVRSHCLHCVLRHKYYTVASYKPVTVLWPVTR
jgi:hypothetical protein